MSDVTVGEWAVLKAYRAGESTIVEVRSAADGGLLLDVVGEATVEHHPDVRSGVLGGVQVRRSRALSTAVWATCVTCATSWPCSSATPALNR